MSSLKLFIFGVLVAFISLISACSSHFKKESSSAEHRSTSAASRQEMSSETAFNPLGDLLGQAQNLLKSIEDPSLEGSATARLLIFHQRSLSTDEEGLNQLADLHFSLVNKALERQGVSSLVRSKLVDRFQVASLSSEEELPINIRALSPSASRLNVQLDQYRGLTFVSYKGQALKQGLQLSVACQVALGLSESDLLSSSKPTMIASLATLEVMDVATYANRCSNRDERWIKPIAELEREQVRLVSRGLNQWGRPELELGPITKSEAPKRFPLFMKAIEKMRSSVLKTQEYIEIEGLKFTLSDCLRPSHYYDEGCRRLALP